MWYSGKDYVSAFTDSNFCLCRNQSKWLPTACSPVSLIATLLGPNKTTHSMPSVCTWSACTKTLSLMNTSLKGDGRVVRHRIPHHVCDWNPFASNSLLWGSGDNNIIGWRCCHDLHRWPAAHVHWSVLYWCWSFSWNRLSNSFEVHRIRISESQVFIMSWNVSEYWLVTWYVTSGKRLLEGGDGHQLSISNIGMEEVCLWR